MGSISVLVGAGCLLFCGIVLGADRYRQRRMMERLERMLEDAKKGTFRESRFDESAFSALENRFSEYLQAGEVLAEKRAAEETHIKTLISDISHQTKTPIANIRLYSELLEETELPPASREYLEALRAQTEKLNFLIASLVKLSRLETGLIKLEPKPSSVRTLVENAAATYADKAASKGLALEVETGEERAVFDEKWTGEALGNLIDNAVKYTESGRIRISTKRYELFVCVEISDTGKGISEEEIPKVFARFYRGKDHRDDEGAGIGLYLAREILSGEGGYIRVRSEKEKGSVFSVFLPATL